MSMFGIFKLLTWKVLNMSLAGDSLLFTIILWFYVHPPHKCYVYT